MCCCNCCQKIENLVIRILEKRHPHLGIKEIVRLMGLIRDRASVSFEDSGNLFEEDDGKWRPVLLILAIMYKLQKVTDDSWYDSDSAFLTDPRQKSGISHVFGYFWHYLFKISWTLVFTEKNDDILKAKLSESFGVEEKDVLKVHYKDSVKIEEHLPDTTIIVHHDRKEIVICICGTKITPAPSMGDIMLDLHADSMDFLQGRAHQGMAQAAANIVNMIKDILQQAARANPGYRMVVVGYSLGAGVSQLVTLLLKSMNAVPDTKLFCLAYGPAPIYTSDAEEYHDPYIFSIVHHNDGLLGLSLHTITKLFLQIRAIDRLNLKRRRICSLAWTRIGRKQEDASGVDRFLGDTQKLEKNEWPQIINILNTVRKSGFDELDLVGDNIFIMKDDDEREDSHVIRHLRGREFSRNLSSNIKLRAGSFDDHMPWGYNSLFKRFGTNTEQANLHILEEFVNS